MKTNEKLKKLEAFLEQSPRDEFILFAMAQEYSKLGEYEASIAGYEKLLEVNMDYVGTYYHLGKTLEKLSQNDRALSIYRKGIEVANRLKDQHSASELMNAKMNLEIEME